MHIRGRFGSDMVQMFTGYTESADTLGVTSLSYDSRKVERYLVL